MKQKTFGLKFLIAGFFQLLRLYGFIFNLMKIEGEVTIYYDRHEKTKYLFFSKPDLKGGEK